MAAKGFPWREWYSGSQRRPQNRCARLGHDPADRRQLALLRGVPRRCRGQHPVDDAAGVEARGHQDRRALEVAAVAEQDVRAGAVRDQEPAPVDSREPVLERPHAPLPGEGSLQPDRGWRAEPEHAVDGDRIAHLHARQEGLGVVVGHVEVGEVGPHLQRVDPRVAHGGTGGRQRERDGRRPRERRHHRRAQPQAAPHQWSGDADRHRAPRERAEGTTTTQSAAEHSPVQG